MFIHFQAVITPHLVSLLINLHTFRYGSVVIVSWFRYAYKEFRESKEGKTTISLWRKKEDSGAISSSFLDPISCQTLCDKDEVNSGHFDLASIDIKYTSYTVREKIHQIQMIIFVGNQISNNFWMMRYFYF